MTVTVEEWLTITEVADHLGIQPGGVYAYARVRRWRQRNEGRVRYYHADDVHTPHIRTKPKPAHLRLAKNITRYRLAIEIARHALRCGLIDEALRVLDGAIE